MLDLKETKHDTWSLLCILTQLSKQCVTCYLVLKYYVITGGNRITPICTVLLTLTLFSIYNHFFLQHKAYSRTVPHLRIIITTERIPSESHQDHPNPLRIHWDISRSLTNRSYKDSLISHSFLNGFGWSWCHSGANFTADTSAPICGTDHSFVHSADRITSICNFFLRLNLCWTLN